MSETKVRRARRLTRERGAEWLERYEAGETSTALAAEFGVTGQTITRAVRRLGGTVRPRGFGGLPGGVSGPASPYWRGGRHDRGDGYIRVWVSLDDPMHSMADKRSFVLEHRLVMARTIHRPLHPWETVHHINGDKADNRPENLQLRSGRHGNGVHYRCQDCGSQNVAPTPLG